MVSVKKNQESAMGEKCNENDPVAVRQFDDKNNDVIGKIIKS